MKTVCVIGLGYIGLPTAAVLAGAGYSVLGVDVNPYAVDTINAGKIHIVEHDLEERVRDAVKNGSLRANTYPEAADVFMICVPTPLRDVEGNPVPQPEMSYVEDAARAIAPFVQPGNLVILESTSPVGATEKVRDAMREAGVNVDSILFAYCPERVLPGRILQELVENDRIVGGLTPKAGETAREFYESFLTKGKVFVTDSRTAEMTKLVENSFRDVNIAFANELSMLCDKLSIDVFELIRLANRHPRVNILEPRCGVGGHCIAVDPWFIVAAEPERAPLIRTAREVNNRKPHYVVDKVEDSIQRFRQEKGRDPIVVVLGLAFKPNVDDLRESPAVEVAEALHARYPSLLVVEPFVKAHRELTLTPLEDGLQRGEILVALVKHDCFVNQVPPDRELLDFCGLTQSV